MYVGGDTGVMHLAAFSGVPVLAIFGPTDPKVNAPYGPTHTIVRKELLCSPCRDKNCKERTCLTSITPEEVFEEVKCMWDSLKSNLQYPNSNIQTMSNVQCAESTKRTDDEF
jgi:hypothetical protein